MSSPEESASSSPISSPSNAQYGSSPQQLTPRSKVKAMLAAIDDESDSDNLAQFTDSKSKVATPISARKEQANDNSRQLNREFEDDAEDEESDVAPAKPRGRLAARLQEGNTGKDESGLDNEHASAYERIRAQLLTEPTRKSGILSPDLRKDGSEGDDEPPKIAPRQIRRVTVDSNGSQSPPRRPINSRGSSPGLFLSPRPVSSPKRSGVMKENSEPDSDLPSDPQITSKVLQLVARKKAERDAKEARARPSPHRKFHGKKSSTNSHPASHEFSEDDIEDQEGEKTLTQQSRPTRKASKKALEEMNRETQRMSRNMQLAHQAKTKKKITKESLFARFNYKTNNSSNESTVQALSSSTAASSAPVSEFEGRQEVDSPPSSPPQSTGDTEIHKILTKLPDLNQESVINALNFSRGGSTTQTSIAHKGDWEEELPTMFEVINPRERPLDKGKGREVVSSHEENLEKPKKTSFTQRQIRVQPHQPQETMNNYADSDNDLEIIPGKVTKPSKPDVFDRLPTKKLSEGHSLQTLRALAHLTSPSKQNFRVKASMSLSEMQTSLQKRARQQAALERAEKIQDLKDRGVLVQTAEERERDQVQVDDLVQKARKEAEDIKQEEKKAARKEKKGNGEDDALFETSDEDEEYKDDETDESNIELSGSDEDELMEEKHDDGSEMEPEAANEGGNEAREDHVAIDRIGPEGFVNTEAPEGSDEEEANVTVSDADDRDDVNELPLHRKSRTHHVINDDEDEEDEEDHQAIASQMSSETVPAIQNPLIPESHVADRPPIDIMGMTQAFAATMAESQTQTGENSIDDQEQDSLSFLGPMPEPNFPVFDVNDSQSMVLDSQHGEQEEQTAAPPVEIELDFSQSQARDTSMKDTQDLPPTATQYSDIPDPTQDVGFALSSPGPEQRFASDPPSTVDTVVLSRATGEETPKVIRKGRLRRRMVVAVESDDKKVFGVHGKENTGFQISANAFDVLKNSKGKGASAIETFDKEKSNAKDMVEEQAQESEDEYAGLGGASDDESGGEEDEEVRKMIEEGEVKVNERELATFYADKERATDEKAVEKLFKDINNGLLRRKRGAEFELSDSEDDVEARQRAKRREFAKMRKALLENENLGKIAENPKKLAFLRAIEDRDDDENLVFLDDAPEDSSQPLPDTQEIPNSQTINILPDSQPIKRKRPLEESTANRPTPAARRTKSSKKPSTLAEIRDSVSFLLEDPNFLPLQPLDSSDIEEEAAKHTTTTDPFGARPHTTAPIIDRISLKRAESSSLSTSASRLAFHDPSSGANGPGFKVPSLLRRATTLATSEDRHGISTTTGTTATTERAAGGGEQGEFVKRGGGKRSSVMGFAREVERRAVVEGVERRREEGRAMVRKGARGLGGLVGVGGWE